MFGDIRSGCPYIDIDAVTSSVDNAFIFSHSLKLNGLAGGTRIDIGNRSHSIFQRLLFAQFNFVVTQNSISIHFHCLFNYRLRSSGKIFAFRIVMFLSCLASVKLNCGPRAEGPTNVLRCIMVRSAIATNCNNLPSLLPLGNCIRTLFNCTRSLSFFHQFECSSFHIFSRINENCFKCPFSFAHCRGYVREI